MSHYLPILLTILFVYNFSFNTEAQDKKSKHTLSLNVPFIINGSTSNDRYVWGQDLTSRLALSYGFEGKYMYKIFSHVSLGTAFGFYKQKFRIKKGAQFYQPNTAIFLKTGNFNYNCLITSIEMSYDKKNGADIFHLGSSFNYLYSFRQKYYGGLNGYEVHHHNMYLGYLIDINLFLEKMIGKKIGIGPSLIIPVVSKWKTDPFFYEPEIAKTKFSFGISICGTYHF
jgi:hypothetical protein